MTGGGSVVLIGASGASGPAFGRYGLREGPALNRLNCLFGSQGGRYPGLGFGGQLELCGGGPGVGEDGRNQLSNLCHQLGSSPEGSPKFVGLLTPYA